MTLVEPKPNPRPWFALWRRESGSFAQLPLLARGIFDEILKLTDDEGVIDLGGREPAEAIAWALGADRADRRALAKYVPMLLADGCLVRDGDRLIAPNFVRFQPRPAPKRPRTNHEAATNEQRTRHEPTTNRPRTDHETRPKSAEPLDFGFALKEEERKGKDRKEKDLPDSEADKPPRASPVESIRELEARYPADLVREARAACALSRRNGTMADGVWLRTLQQLAPQPLEAAVHAMRVFTEKHADGDKSEAYMVAIAKREAKGGARSSARLPGRAAPCVIDPERARESQRRAMEIFGGGPLPEVSR